MPNNLTLTLIVSYLGGALFDEDPSARRVIGTRFTQLAFAA